MPDRPTPILQTMTPHDMAYMLHHALYGAVHSNPAKCGAYNAKTCKGCGKCHACPATN